MLSRDQVIERLRAEVAAAGTAKAWAAANRVSPQYVSDVLAGRRDPGFKILDPLGLASRVVYVERAP